MNGYILDISSFFTQLGLTISSNLSWKPHIHTIAKNELRNSGFFLEAVAISHLLSCQLYTNPRFVLLWSTAPMSGWCSYICSPSSRQCPVYSYPAHQQSKHHQFPTVSLPPSSFSRSFHFLPLFSRTLFSGNQEYYSIEACSSN